MPLTTIQSGMMDSVAQYYGFKNRIINPGMVIDQRNNGAAVTVNNTGSNFGVDRFFATGQSADGVFTVQRSSVAPAGFTNSLLATVTTADSSVGASQIYVIAQRIEGFNIADLGWGAAGAQTVTLSFWVRSSLTGTFGGSITNETGYSYPFTYTISAANTFEQKSVTITGAPAGTWLTTNGTGVAVIFTLGSGTTFTGTAGSWSANVFYGATGQTQLMATNGATFYITGVQLEKGSTATSFDYRDYGTELVRCQRYYWSWSTSQFTRLAIGFNDTTTSTQIPIFLPVPLRATPSLGLTNMTSNGIAITGSGVSVSNTGVWITAAGTGLTVGATQIYTAASSTGVVALSAEL